MTQSAGETTGGAKTVPGGGADATGQPHGDCFPVRDYLDGVVAKLRDHVGKALLDHDADAIHAARVSTRRMKAAVDLFNPLLRGAGGRKRFAKVLKKLRRRLGEQRDLDVMLGHLRDLSADHGKATEWLAERLSREQDRVRAKAADKAGPDHFLEKVAAWETLRGQVDGCREAVAALLGESLHLQLDTFAERAARLTESTPGDELHQLRIAGKKLRYTLEMAEEDGHDVGEGILPAFKKMQDALGEWHDFVVLTQRAAAAVADDHLVECDMALAGSVLRLSEDTLRRAIDSLHEFGRLWAEKGADVSAAIRSAFPLTRPAPPASPAAQPPIDATSTNEPRAPVGEAEA